MSRDHHQKVEKIFQELLDLPAEERAAALESRCGHDETLRRDVAELLEHFEAARPEFLQEPVFARGASDDELPESVGPYSVVAQLGEGGMGVIYEAVQAQPNRRVAIKVLRAGLYSKSQLSRFQGEWDALGRLNHPGIASVYEAGLGEVVLPGRSSVELPYIAMELVEGRALLDHVEHEKLDRGSRMELLAEICDAVHYAHGQSVIHRDLKPSNIVVDGAGRPKILDFGVARITDQERTQHTRTGDVIGTVRYMSPEQLLGRREVDARSDIYSLGVILFELLTGKSPHGKSDTSISSRIVEHERGFAPRVAEHDPELRGDIDAIIRMAMASDPEERYGSAADLAEDIRRNLRGDPVQAPAESRWGHWRQSLRRRRGLASAAVVMVVAAVLLVLVGNPFGDSISLGRGIAAGDRLAVMYFDNLAEPEDSQRRGEILTELLISGLSESERLNVVSSQRLHDLLGLLDADAKAIDRSMATRLAQRANARWMMHGSILQSEPSLLVKADIVNVASGDVAASMQTRTSAGEPIFAVAERLVVEAKDALGLPEGDPKNTSTRSEEAYRHYLEGKAYRGNEHMQEARESYREAVRVDSTFALAAFELANLLHHRDDPEASRYHALAERHARRASWRDQQYIEAGLGQSASVRAAKAILERHPRDPDALWILSYYGDTEERVTYGTQLIEIDPGHETAYVALAYAYISDGNFDQALWACDQYEALAPGEPNVFDTRGEIYAAFGRLDDAIAQYSMSFSLKPDFGDYNSTLRLGRLHLFKGEFALAEEQFKRLIGVEDPLIRATGRSSLVEMYAFRGQIGRALRENEAAISVDRMDGLDFLQAELNRLQRAALLLAELGDSEAALEKLTATYAGEDTAGLGSLTRLIFLARIGARDVADQYWQQFEARSAEQGGIPSDWNGWFNAAKGHHQIMLGDYGAAAAHLERATDFRWNRIALGRSYVELKRWEDVIRVLEPLSTDYRGALLNEPVDAARLYYHLGVAYHELGRSEDAIAQLQKFVHLWENADPELEEPEDARRRLVVLRSTRNSHR